MALLLYGVIQTGGAELDLPKGVADCKIEETELSHLACFFSEHSTLAGLKTPDAAMEFHRVISSILAVKDLIPFRFPTVLADYSELQQELGAHAEEYTNWLARVRGMVQMETRITYRDSALPAGDQNEKKGSGAEYLRQRQNRQASLQSAATKIREQIRTLAKGWRQRESSDHLRCFVLIKRESVAEFQRALSRVTISPDLSARASGPWPATEFFDKETNGER